MSNTAFLSLPSHRRRFNETVRHTIISHQEDTLTSSHRNPLRKIRVQLGCVSFVMMGICGEMKGR